jgi:amino acid transporter
MISELKRLFVGQPLATEALAHERLSKRIALAVFSSDALSSVAYATEAILIALAVAGAAALEMVTPIAIGIAALLITVAFSYRQTIIAYPQGGGTYIVSRENLGTTPSLVAASSLLIDYILTVAVSMSAAVAAITSAVERLEPYRVELAVGLIGVVTLANLRGVKESGRIFAVPTYLFIVSTFALIGAGLYQVIAGQVVEAPPPEIAHIPAEIHTLSLFLLLRAFAAGCTALTGIEAIADGVPAFKQPEARNASITLVIMVVILCTMFLGITVLADAYHIIPDGSPEPETANSQLARAIFGTGSPFYYILQIATMLILVLASNTAFADFPRLSYFLASDRFLPRQFAQRGDRLVFSNGVLALGICSALLVVAFGAKEQALLPLYAIGVFTSFTLSQLGMVQRSAAADTRLAAQRGDQQHRSDRHGHRVGGARCNEVRRGGLGGGGDRADPGPDLPRHPWALHGCCPAALAGRCLAADAGAPAYRGGADQRCQSRRDSCAPVRAVAGAGQCDRGVCGYGPQRDREATV